MVDSERWDRAIAHAREYLETYQGHGHTGVFGTLGIMTAIRLYEEGDRSEALLKALESIK